MVLYIDGMKPVKLQCIDKTGQADEHMARIIHITEHTVSRYADLFCGLFSNSVSMWTTYFCRQINECEQGAVVVKKMIWDIQCSKRNPSHCYLSTKPLMLTAVACNLDVVLFIC